MLLLPMSKSFTEVFSQSIFFSARQKTPALQKTGTGVQALCSLIHKQQVIGEEEIFLKIILFKGYPPTSIIEYFIIKENSLGFCPQLAGKHQRDSCSRTAGSFFLYSFFLLTFFVKVTVKINQARCC